eukprot:8453531-Alexandrium_andersonii.AAC.1
MVVPVADPTPAQTPHFAQAIRRSAPVHSGTPKSPGTACADGSTPSSQRFVQSRTRSVRKRGPCAA